MLKKFPSFPKVHLLAAGSLSVAIGAVLMLSPSAEVEANRISIALPLHSASPDTSTSTSATLAPVSSTALVEQLSAKDTAAAVDQALEADSLTSDRLDDEGAEASDVVVNADYTAPSHQELSEVGTAITETEQWQSYKVGSGDSLSAIFKRAGRDTQELLDVLAADKDKMLGRLYPGNVLDFSVQDGKLAKVRLQRSQLETIMVERTDKGFVANKIVRTPEAHTAFGAGTITSSLFLAGQQAGLSQSMIMELATIFGYDIDFALDIREGDQFNLVYEELHLDGKKIGYGNVLAASFTNRGETYLAVRYTDSDGRTSYYRPDGKSLRKAFIRTPVDFARISSHFNLSRKHPILHKIRAHKGTDYAASHGTPIKSVGEGKVIFAGVKGGYGNTVVIQHGQSITTLYAHMKRFAKGIRVGSRVDQSQVIGYVGSSGLATGPHLHYEFRVNGVPKNPVTVKFPEASPVPKHELARFKQQTATHLAQLETFAQSHRLALNGR